MAKRMNTANVLLSSLVVAGASLITSCEDFDNGFDEATIRYNQSFIERYGQIDPNHNWGFGEIGTVDKMGGGKRVTRADQETNLTKNDQFIRWQADMPMWEIRTDNSLPDNAKIPGFPSDIDGKYYYTLGDNNEDGNLIVYASENVLEDVPSEKRGDLVPYGDVSDLEITLVSEWFRTHQPTGPSRVPMFTEFFIQDISQDKDRIPAGGKYGETVDQAENSQGFMQDINFGLEKLGMKLNDGDDWVHINDFNSDKANKLWEQEDICSEDNTYGNRTFLYWKGNGRNNYTVSFSYRNTSSNERFEDYWLVYLSLPEGSDQPVCHGWYLGFDFDDNLNYNYENDGYYNNWIVKLSPANPNFRVEYPEEEDNSKSRRVMCEDLGTSDDFDFNDLVFDVYYTEEEKQQEADETKYTANITVQASGGTLPIYIGEPKADESNEVHHILGAKPNENGKYDPIINKGGNRTTVDMTIPNLETTDPDNVEIYVVDNENKAIRKLTIPAERGGQYETVPPGTNVPQKICVPVTTDWTDEHQQIEDKYPGFRDWVTDHNNTWWIYDADDTDTGYKGLKWGDGSTGEQSVTLDEGGSATLTCTGDGTIEASGYDHAIVSVTVTSSSATSPKTSTISITALQTGSTTITLTQKETGETLRIKVVVGEEEEEDDESAQYGEKVTLSAEDYNPNGTHDDYRNAEYTISSDKFNGYNSDIIITFVLSESSNTALYCNSSQEKKEGNWTAAGSSMPFPLTYDEYKDGVIFMTEDEQTNLKVYIKEASSAKIRTARRR